MEPEELECVAHTETTGVTAAYDVLAFGETQSCVASLRGRGKASPCVTAPPSSATTHIWRPAFMPGPRAGEA